MRQRDTNGPAATPRPLLEPPSALLSLMVVPFVAAACGGGATGPDGESRISSVTVTPAEAELSAFGATQDFEATATDQNGETISGLSFTWSSSDPAVAIVDGQGRATAEGNGGVRVRAEAGGVTGSAELVVRAGDLAWRQLAAGPFNSCGVTTHGTVYCWGSNRHGQLGDDGPSRSSPVLIDSDPFFDQVASSGQTCTVTSGDKAYCWGSNSVGEMGTGESGEGFNPTPEAVRTTESFEQIGTGGNHTCAVSLQDRGWCWGLNGDAQLGDGTTDDRNTPVEVATTAALVQISPARSLNPNHTCAVADDGTAYCWGTNADGELGDGTTTLRTSPVAVDGGVTFEQISAGGRHSCAVASDGVAYCWGANGEGQLGDGTTEGRTTPVQVSGGLSFEHVTAGDAHSCGLTADGTAYCWGTNAGGELGDGTLTDRASPVQVTGGHTFDQVQAGFHHTCGVTPDGVAYCWGINGDGQLGDGTFTQSNEPARVPDPGGSG